MVEIVKYNDNNVRDDEIDEVVTRVKAFIVSSKNNMIVGYDDDGFQLIGGYVQSNEDIVNALANIIYNESGIALDAKDKIEPFYEIRQYFRNYQNSGKNRLSDLIYFVVNTDKLPNLKKLKLTDRQIAEKMPLEVVRRGLFGKDLKDFIDQETDTLKRAKAKELLMAYDKFKEIYKF